MGYSKVLASRRYSGGQDSGFGVGLGVLEELSLIVICTSVFSLDTMLCVAVNVQDSRLKVLNFQEPLKL